MGFSLGCHQLSLAQCFSNHEIPLDALGSANVPWIAVKFLSFTGDPGNQLTPFNASRSFWSMSCKCNPNGSTEVWGRSPEPRNKVSAVEHVDQTGSHTSKNKTEPNAIYSAIGFLHPGKKHQTQSSNQRKTSFWKKKDTWNYQVVGQLNSQFLNFLPPIQCQIINAKYGYHHRFTTNLLRSGSWEHSHWKLQVLTIGRPSGAAQFLATAADKRLNCQKLGSRDMMTNDTKSTKRPSEMGPFAKRSLQGLRGYKVRARKGAA